MNIENLFENKKPMELTDEELVVLVNSIASCVHSKYADFNTVQEPEDTAQEILTYGYEKSNKGKTGIKELQATCTMKHFKNILFREAYNTINYKLRKNSYKNMLYNTDSIEVPIDENRSIGDILEDRTENIEQYFEDMDSFFNKIENKYDKRFKIKYDKSYDVAFSYRNLMKLCYDLTNKNRLSSTNFEDNIYYRDSNQKLDKKELRTILSNFRQYLKENEIFGGIQ